MNKRLLFAPIMAALIGFFGWIAYGDAAGTNNAAPTNNAPNINALLEQAGNGDATAQCELGYCYYHGNGVEQNYTNALMWFRKSAEQGNPVAQRRLGLSYERGYGIQPDDTNAINWCRKSAEQGDADAQSRLGFYYYYGKGVAQDYVEAARWYRNAANQGNAIAQTWLARCYRLGEGVPQNHTRAVMWYRKAAEQGDELAQFDLGFCYEHGNGVRQDHSEAVKWYTLAAEQGNKQAQYLLKEMTIAEVLLWVFGTLLAVYCVFILYDSGLYAQDQTVEIKNIRKPSRLTVPAFVIIFLIILGACVLFNWYMQERYVETTGHVIWVRKVAPHMRTGANPTQSSRINRSDLIIEYMVGGKAVYGVVGVDNSRIRKGDRLPVLYSKTEPDRCMLK